MEKLNFGQKLMEVRKAKGLTQQDVAERSNVTIRTIQRIESGMVTPRASTIKIISESLGFDFFEPSNTGYDVVKENHHSKLKTHNLLWHLTDLFNLKTQAMKKISILSTTAFLIVYLFVSVLNVQAQTDESINQSLIIQLNEDESVKRVEAAFTNNLTLDSLLQIKSELHEIGITVHYKKIEFNTHNLLVTLECEVLTNDEYSGSFTAVRLNEENKDKRIGFYRDYNPNSKRPFGTGLLYN